MSGVRIPPRALRSAAQAQAIGQEFLLLKKLAALCLLAALMLHGLPTLRAQDSIPITYGVPFEGSFTADNTEARFIFEGKQGEVIYIFPQGTELFSTIEFDIRLTDSRGAALGAVYNKERLKPVLIAELPSSGRYSITLTGNTRGAYRLELQQSLNLLPNAQAEGTIAADESRFYIIRSPQPLKIALTYTRLDGSFSPELRIDDFVQGFPREMAAVGGRALKTVTLELSLEADVEYLVVLAQKPFDFASILETVTPLRYRIEIKSLQ